jgi:hypothetical protein
MSGWVVGQRHGVPQGILRVFIITLYENVFQNPEHFRTQVSLSHKQSTLQKVSFCFLQLTALFRLIQSAKSKERRASV